MDVRDNFLLSMQNFIFDTTIIDFKLIIKFLLNMFKFCLKKILNKLLWKCMIFWKISSQLILIDVKIEDQNKTKN